MVSTLRGESGLQVVGESSSAREAIELSRKLRPSVIVLALRLETDGGASALATLHKAVPAIPILAVAERGEAQCMVLNPPGSPRLGRPGDRCATGTDCLQLAVLEGASGTIRRSSSPSQLFEAIRVVASGRSWYESGTASSIIQHALVGNGAGARPSLSARELEVAELIATGYSNKEISSSLGIGEPTVKKHVGTLLSKLGLQDRLQVGLYVARNPIVLLPLRKRAP